MRNGEKSEATFMILRQYNVEMAYLLLNSAIMLWSSFLRVCFMFFYHK